MELNGFNSDDYIYLEMNNDLHNKHFDLNKGTVLRYKRSEFDVFSRLMSQGFYDNLEFVQKEKLKDDDVLPTQVYEKIYFKEDGEAYVCLWPKERYCFNEWVRDHLFTNSDFKFSLFGPPSSKRDLNYAAINQGCKKMLPDKDRLPMIEIGKKNIDLIFSYKKGEELDFNDPGVASFLMDRDMVALLLNSHAIVGDEKLKYFEEDFKNAFHASDGISSDDNCIFRYYKINDDINVKNQYQLPYIHLNESSFDDKGYLRYVYLETFSSMDFERQEEEIIREFATEVGIDEAKKMHTERLREKKRHDEEEMAEWIKEREEGERKPDEAYQEKKYDENIFPGVNGNFIHNDGHKDENKKSLEEIKEFYKNLKQINPDVLNKMYFYGGTIPYMLTSAESSRDFGDIDIFVPISEMTCVREELSKIPSFKIYFDSKDLTRKYHFNSEVESKELEKKDSLDDTIDFLAALQSDDNIVDENGQTALENYFTRGNKTKVLQDFGLKGSLFGVNISIFPVYQYKNDLMAKSFNISDVYEYLLAVRVMNKTSLNNFAKNVNIYDNNINILPLEYTILSKESAIKSGYIKREEKDAIDILYIMKHKDELGISDAYIETIRENYPDYSIAIAYYLNGFRVEKMSGEKYKEYMLMNKGKMSLS